MPTVDHEHLRAASSYRVSFPVWDRPDGMPSFAALAGRIADIMETFSPVEMRILPETIDAYVLVPVDVMPEALDRKAVALRAKWAGAPKEGT